MTPHGTDEEPDETTTICASLPEPFSYRPRRRTNRIATGRSFVLDVRTPAICRRQQYRRNSSRTRRRKRIRSPLPPAVTRLHIRSGKQASGSRHTSTSGALGAFKIGRTRHQSSIVCTDKQTIPALSSAANKDLAICQHSIDLVATELVHTHTSRRAVIFLAHSAFTIATNGNLLVKSHGYILRFKSCTYNNSIEPWSP